MIKFDYEIITAEKLDATLVSQINDYYSKRQIQEPLVIQVKNTKSIDRTSLGQLNPNVKISAIGAYSEELKSPSERTQEKVFNNTLYNKHELNKIIKEFEKIESLISTQWSKYDIVVFLSEILTRNIMYDPEYYMMKQRNEKIQEMDEGVQDKSDYFDRTLRGILNRKTVCAGYAVIFKELANRNGIECACAFGKVPSGVGHTWNLVRIDSKIHPLDITWKNTKYRNGDFTNIDNISCDVERFRKSHIPANPKFNENLVQMDKDLVEEARRKTSNRKNFSSTTYTMERSDKTKFVLSQFGKYKGMYRYLYSELQSNGELGVPQILFSESNFLKEREESEFDENNHYKEFEKSFVNVLFSKENIKDSIKDNDTNYIGKCELKGTNGYAKSPDKIDKPTKTVKDFKMGNVRSKKREDGSYVTIVQFPSRSNQFKYSYFVYVLSSKTGVIEYNVYSDNQYFEMNPNHAVEDKSKEDSEMTIN